MSTPTSGGPGPGPTPNGSPFWLRILASPQMLANVVAFGAALLLLYTAAVEWPRQANRFHETLTAFHEVGAENQRILKAAEQQQARREELLRDLKKAITDLETELKRLKKEQ